MKHFTVHWLSLIAVTSARTIVVIYISRVVLALCNFGSGQSQPFSQYVELG